jgi:osmotically-inducible protein OsmY
LEAAVRGDSEIERDVKEELKSLPDIDATDIAVSVVGGVVTLTGFTHSYFDKYQAEMAAKRVAGVLGIANDIEVRLRDRDRKPDPEIAREAAAALKSELPYYWERIQVVVKDGWVDLTGELEWQFQREAATRAVRRVKGIRGVSNLIKLKPLAEPVDIKRKIEDAVKRNARLRANTITVEAKGGEVILKGRVQSWAERQEIERIAWSAPGVTAVDNQIFVSPSD